MSDVSYSEHLILEFFNHLKLNQKECALYCFELLLNRRGCDVKDRSGLLTLLNNLIINPFPTCSVKVDCEHLLKFSWHCLQYLPGGIDQEDQKPRLREEVEFRLLLSECERICDNQDFLQELQDVHSSKLNQKYARYLRKIDKPFTLSQNSLNQLQFVLQNNPCLGYHLSLMLRTDSLVNELAMVHYKALLELTSDMLVNENPDLDRLLLQLMLYFLPIADSLSEDQLDVLFQSFQLLHNRPCHLDLLVVCSMLSSSSLHWFSHHIEEVTLRLAERRDCPFYLSTLERHLFVTLLEEDKEKFWCLILILLRRHNLHLVDLIIDICLKMVQHDDIPALDRLFKASDLVNCLRPLIMVLGWRSCNTISRCEALFEVCRLSKAEEKTELGNECKQILIHFNFYKSCFNALGISNQLNGIDLEALHNLDTASRLKIIGSVTRLQSVDPGKINSLLNTPFSQDVPEPYHIARQVDIQIYNAYKTMCILSDTVLQFSSSSSMGGLALEYHTLMSSHRMTDLQHVYTTKVIKRLDEAKPLVADLLPLSLRMEVLENAFSLLFMPSSHPARPILHRVTSRMSDEDAASSEWSLEDEELRPSRVSSDGSTGLSIPRRDSFICPPFLVRDLLLWVKAGLEDLQSADVALRKVDSEVDSKKKNFHLDPARLNRELEEAMVGRQQRERLREKMNSLTGHLADALWRLDLLVGADQLQMKYGVVHTLNMLKGSNDHPFERGTVRVTRKQRRIGQAGKRKGRSCVDVVRRSYSAVGAHGVPAERGVPPDLVSYLLADSETMIAICLKRGLTERVAEVVKIFSIDGPSTASETVFRDHFERLTTNLRNSDVRQNSNGNLSDSGSFPIKFGQPGLRALSAISNTNGSPQSVIDDLLSLDTSSRPVILSQFQENGENNSLSYLLANESVQKVATIIDVVLHGTKHAETLISLLELAKKKLFTSLDKFNIKDSTDQDDSSSSPMSLSNYKAESRDIPFVSFIEEVLRLLRTGPNSGSVMEENSNAFVDINLNFPLHESSKNQFLDNVSRIASAMIKFRELTKPMPTEAIPHEELDSKTIKKLIDESLPVQQFRKLEAIIKKSTHGNSSLLKILKMGDQTQTYGFLTTLMSHIRVLLVNQIRCKNQDMVVPALNMVPNCFEVLTQSPTEVLGELLFKINMPPVLIESLAGRLGLNISHVILQNCCPGIPLRRQNMSIGSSEYEECYNPTIWNYTEDYAAEGFSHLPLDCVREILNQLIEVLSNDWFAAQAGYSKGLNDQEGFISVHRLRAMATSDQVKQLLLRTNELRFIEYPASLEPESKKVAFLLNLHNLMVVHWLLQMCKDESATGIFVQESFEALVKRKNFCYKVGGLGVISLFGIRENLLDIPDPTSLILGPYIKPDKDVSFVYFGLIDPTYDSMPLKVYSGEFLEEELQDNLRMHLRKRITFHSSVIEERKSRFRSITDRDKGEDIHDKFTLPSTYNIFGRFCLYKYRSLDSMKSRKLLSFLERFCPNNVKDEISKIIAGFGDDACENSDLVTLEWTTSMESIGLVIDSLPVAPVLRKDTSMSLTSSIADRPVHYPNPPRHPLSLNALDYLRAANPLLATLSMLICPDTFVDQSQELVIYSQHYAMDDSAEVEGTVAAKQAESVSTVLASTPPAVGGLLARCSRKSSTATSLAQDYILDVKSYRYQRLTADFPHLAQYIEKYWIPISRGRASLKQGEVDSILKFCITTSSEDIRWNLLSHTSSAAYKAMVHFNAMYLLRRHKYLLLVDVIESLPARTAEEMSVLREMKDFALTSQLRSYQLNTASADLAACLWAISEPVLQAKTLQRYLSRLSVYDAVRLLHSSITCLEGRGDAEISTLVQSLRPQLSRMRIYEAMATVAVRRKDVDPNSDLAKILMGSWDVAERMSLDMDGRRRILNFLLSAKEYTLARKWTRMFDVDLKEMIEAAALEDEIEVGGEDAADAAVERLSELLETENLAFTLCVCRTIVQQSKSALSVLLASAFGLFQLGDHLVEDDREELVKSYLGAHMLRQLPEDIEAKTLSSFLPLMRHPDLILEQMLMNMKVEWFSEASSALRQELAHLAPIWCPSRLTSVAINNLVTHYAEKAVELAAILMQNSPSGNDSSHDVCVSTSLDNISLHSVSMRRSRRISSVTEMNIMDETSSPVFQESETDGRFKMPEDPPTRDQWVPDDQANICMCCRKVRFSMYNRRHHCRRCGRVVCGDCSRARAPVLGIVSRVCSQCNEAMSNVDSLLYRRSLNDDQPSLNNSMGERQVSLLTLTTPLPLVQSDENCDWKLSASGEIDGSNDRLREDFYYEQAPSIHLALALLDLHSDSEECGKAILGMCEKLAAFLQSGPDGQPNPEVDYPLVIEIIRSLLVSAKFRFFDAGRDDGVHRCDQYIDVVDLMQILVHANYRSKLPAFTQLVRQDRVRALRDRLIVEERLDLALQVSLKCGHDPSQVWAAMGLRDLEFGNYSLARDNFAKCFKASDKKNSMARKKYLDEIIKTLDDNHLSGQMLLHSSGMIKSFKHLLDEPEKKCKNAIQQRRIFLDECFFYLETYGDQVTYLRYMAKQKLWQKAVKFVADSNVSPEVFIEVVVNPAMSSDCLETLRQQMIMVDKTLRIWDRHLNELCKYLHSTNHHKELYETQLFMRDYFRAAVYCMRSFAENAKSYMELNARMKTLNDALSHLSQAKQMLSTREQTPGRSTVGMREIEKVEQRILLQQRVTSFLNEPMVLRYQSIYKWDSKEFVPTVFDVGARRIRLCLMILFSTNVLTDGLRMAVRVAQETDIQLVEVFVAAGRYMMAADKLNMTLELLSEIRDLGHSGESQVDNVVVGIMKGLTDKQKTAPEVNKLMKLIIAEPKKVEALMILNQLRAAYLLALRIRHDVFIRAIYERARASKDVEVIDLCLQYINKLDKR